MASHLDERNVRISSGIIWYLLCLQLAGMLKYFDTNKVTVVVVVDKAVASLKMALSFHPTTLIKKAVFRVLLFCEVSQKNAP